MFIAPRVSLKNVLIDSISIVMPSEDAKDFKKKYKEAKVTALRKKGRSLREDQKPGPVRSISVEEYLKLA